MLRCEIANCLAEAMYVCSTGLLLRYLVGLQLTCVPCIDSTAGARELALGYHEFPHAHMWGEGPGGLSGTAGCGKHDSDAATAYRCMQAARRLRHGLYEVHAAVFGVNLATQQPVLTQLGGCCTNQQFLGSP